MLDWENNKLKLVEFNTIAAALTSLCQKVYEVQSYILEKYSDLLNFAYTKDLLKDDGFGPSQGKSIS
jgi:hypothetical protein